MRLLMEIYLRDLSHTDLKCINKWRQNKKIGDMLGGNFRYVNIEADELWFEDYMKNRKNQVRCMICLKETEQAIGAVSLSPIDFLNQKAEFHIIIGEESYWGKGVGEKSARLILEHGFENLNLNRIYLSVLKENYAAIRLYEKVGFKKEGIEEEALYKKGEFKTVVKMRILKEEYLINKKN